MKSTLKLIGALILSVLIAISINACGSNSGGSNNDRNAAYSWEKTFGGADSSEVAYSVQQTSDGGYIAVGYAGSGAEMDIYLVKIDKDGNSIWEKTFGFSGRDTGYSVQQTSDGGYIIAGYTTSYGAGSSDAYLIKTDSAGNIIWEKTFGGPAPDVGLSVQQTADGGFIVAGRTFSFGSGGSVSVDRW